MFFSTWPAPRHRRYATDIANIDGFRVHDKPCGRCSHERAGVKCGNKASRAKREGDRLLMLCTAHYNQRAKETGAVGHLHG